MDQQIYNQFGFGQLRKSLPESLSPEIVECVYENIRFGRSEHRIFSQEDQKIVDFCKGISANDRYIGIRDNDYGAAILTQISLRMANRNNIKDQDGIERLITESLEELDEAKEDGASSREMKEIVIASESAEQFEDVCGLFSVSYSEKKDKEVFDNIFSIANFGKEKLRDFLKLMGIWKKAFGLAKRKKKVNGNGASYGVKVGGFPIDSIPSELALLSDNAAKVLFAQKMQQNQLMTKDKKSKEKSNSGPVLILVDISSSMNEYFDGFSAFLWSQALAVQTCLQLLEEGRKFEVAMFNNNVHELSMPNEKNGKSRTIIAKEILSVRANGSTNFDRAFAFVRKKTKENKKMDIMFISDDMSNFRQTREMWNMTLNDSKLYYVHIGKDSQTGQGQHLSAKDVSEKFISVSSFANKLGEISEGVTSFL